MQHDYVTKKEFNEFRDEMYEFRTDMAIRFDNVEKSIRDLRSYVDEGFSKMEEYINNSFMAFGSEIDIKLDKHKKEILEEVPGIIAVEVRKVFQEYFPNPRT